MQRNAGDLVSDGYKSCKITGKGKIYSDQIKSPNNFKIVELSAEKVKIKTSAKYEINSEVNLKIYLDGILFQLSIKSKGKILNNSEDIYEVKLIGLSEADINEINEIVLNCGDDF